jgi:hypothetical protein
VIAWCHEWHHPPGLAAALGRPCPYCDKIIGTAGRKPTRDHILPKTLLKSWSELDRLAYAHHAKIGGRKYGAEYGFPDLLVPKEVWLKAKPYRRRRRLALPVLYEPSSG